MLQFDLNIFPERFEGFRLVLAIRLRLCFGFDDAFFLSHDPRNDTVVLFT